MGPIKAKSEIKWTDLLNVDMLQYIYIFTKFRIKSKEILLFKTSSCTLSIYPFKHVSGKDYPSSNKERGRFDLTSKLGIYFYSITAWFELAL